MSEQTKVTSKKGQKSKKPTKKKPCLIVVEGDYIGEVYMLDQESNVIGRSELADICIDSSAVSRRHAMIKKMGEHFQLADLQSTNGTELNGDTILEANLSDGDKITIGDVALKFCYHDNIDQDYHEKLRQLAVKDGLTRINNKRFFMDSVEKEFKYAVRYEVNLAIVMFDIDHFKSINDTFGHQAGDHVLKKIASTLENKVRGYDLFARYGGEEFIFLLRNISEEDAVAFAERIRSTIDEQSIIFKTDQINVTVSVGVAINTNDQSYESVDDLIAAADASLYQAKQSGRNRVGNLISGPH